MAGQAPGSRTKFREIQPALETVSCSRSVKDPVYSKPVDVPRHVSRYTNLTKLELSTEDIRVPSRHKKSSAHTSTQPTHQEPPPPNNFIYYFEEAETFDNIVNEPLSTVIIKKNDTIKLYNIHK